MSDEERSEENTIIAMFNGIKDYFRNGTFCDLTIFGQEGDTLKGIKCHALVICSVAQALKHLLIEENEDKYLFLPEIPYEMVSKFVNDIYDGLGLNDFSLNISEELFGVLQMGQNDAYKPAKDDKDLVEIVVEQNNATKQNPLELILPDVANDDGSNMDGTYLVDTSNLTEDHHFPSGAEDGRRSYIIHNAPVNSPKSNTNGKTSSNRKRAAAGEAWGPLTKMVSEPKRLMTSANSESPYNLESLPGSLATAQDFSQLKSNLHEVQGSFVASTNSYYTVSRVTNEKGLNVVSCDGNERQFRMKLPEKSICAFLAIGCRKGRNIACTLASTDLTSWPAESTFQNMIEATKRIGGLSFGDILKHPRCAASVQGSKEKFSKSAVHQMKETLKDRGHDEKSQMSKESVAELKTFDDSYEKMDFQHLPARKTLEFHFVKDLGAEEILDYALLHGESHQDLTLQSFFNFDVQKFTRLRLITTMCDTLACFLGLNNLNPLSQHPLVVDAYNKYANKTIETIALQDLLQEGRGKCKDLIEITDANYAPATTEEMVTDVVVVDGKILVTPSVSKTVHHLPPAKRGPKKKPPKELPCPHCKKVFAKEILLQGHIERMHSFIDNASQEEKSCGICNKALKSSQSLRDHVYYYHSPKTCEICDKEFPGAYLFYYHRNKEHPTTVFCDICGSEFKSKEKLRVHKINKHLSDEQKPYVCSICGKGYAHKTKLESHQMNVHIRSRPYKCRLDSCDADFNELANRNAHERNVHQFRFPKKTGTSE